MLLLFLAKARTNFENLLLLQSVSIMGANEASTRSHLPPLAANISTKPPGWSLVNLSTRPVRRHPDQQQYENDGSSTPGWHAIQNDFERRLSRFGIKISDANNNSASVMSSKPSTIESSLPNTHAIMEDYAYQNMTGEHAALTELTDEFPPLETSAIARFTNSKKETKIEMLERQLRKARAEAQIWKEESEARERDLRMSYRETMEWRTKYEDLYSAVIQEADLKPQELRGKRDGTKSLS